MGWSSVNVSRDALDSWAALYGRPRSLAATRMAVRARERAFQVRMPTAKPDVATVATSVIIWGRYAHNPLMRRERARKHRTTP
jgi:hypothetical protein